MKRKRGRHDPALKARVAPEAPKGVRTIQGTAWEYGIHPARGSRWGKVMVDNAAMVFEPGAAKAGAVEPDWLAKKSEQPGL